MTTALDELYGLGFGNCDSEDANYSKVSLDEIQRIAQTHLNPGNAVVAILRPPDGTTVGQEIKVRKSDVPKQSARRPLCPKYPRDRRVVHAKHPYQPGPLKCILRMG